MSRTEASERKHDEFDCAACGQHVYSTPPVDPPPTRCATCLWLDQYIDDPDEREALRRRYCDAPGLQLRYGADQGS